MEKRRREDLNGIIIDDHQFSYFTKMKKQKTLVLLVI
jgi:hypothetical protein